MNVVFLVGRILYIYIMVGSIFGIVILRVVLILFLVMFRCYLNIVIFIVNLMGLLLFSFVRVLMSLLVMCFYGV